MKRRSLTIGNASTRPRLNSDATHIPAVATSASQPLPERVTPPTPADTVTPTLTQTATNLSSPDEAYTVFISHAGEDKATMAIPLRERLLAKGITAFVDEADMPSGTDAVQAMTHAMETARIGVIILSPEFVARKWPMKEAMHFVKRYDERPREGGSSRVAPMIIPCFYRLSVHDLYKEPRIDSNDPNDKLLYEKSRFFERQQNGEPEADVVRIKATLSKLHGIMGVRNDVDANNDSSYLMSTRRGLLLDKLCTEILNSVPEGMRMHTSGDTTQGRNCDSSQVDSFRKVFPPKLIGKKAVLDFGSLDAQGDPKTPECWVKQYLLESRDHAPGIVSLHGMGGVGKSTIVKVLMSEDDIRQRYPDGVHLIKLGSDASSNALLERICYILERSGAEKKVQSLRERNDVEEVLDFFMTWFEGKRCVFFIDDVLEGSVNVRALSRLCDVVNIDGGNMVLITTREHEIASLTEDAKIVTLTPREIRGEVSRKILLFHAAVLESDVVKDSAADSISEILDICAGLPVSLAAAGKSVRKLIRLGKRRAVNVWAQYLSRLNASRQTLLRQNVGSYGNLYATFAASVEFLDEETPEEKTGSRTKCSFAELHRRLCVMRKQEAVPNTMLKHLWETESEEDAEMIAMMFVEVGLGDHETTQRDREFQTRFSLHDSVHDFAVSEARRRGEIAESHNLLLEGYGSGHEDVPCELEDKNVKWWSQELQDDGYIHKQLCRHLIESRRRRELCKLLLTPLWAERQVEVNGIMYSKDDFEIGMNEMKEDEETREALSLISSAVTLSSGIVMWNMSELWFQLHGRLIGCVKGNRVLEKYVKWMETDAGKPRVLSLNEVLVGAGGRNTKIISVGHRGVMCMSLFPDEERVACGCYDGSVVVADIRRSEIEREWQAYEGEEVWNVRSIGVAHNGTRILTRSRNRRTRKSSKYFAEMRTLDAWNVESGNEVRRIFSLFDKVSCFAMTHDGTCVVCVSEEGSFGWWDIRRRVKVVPGINVKKDARDIALLQDGERAIIRYGNGMLKLWNIRTGEEIYQFRDIHHAIDRIAVTPDERRVVICRGDFVTLWDLESRHQIWGPKYHDGRISDVAVSKDGSRIVTGDCDGVIRIQDLESGDQICTPLKHGGIVTEVSFLGNKDLIVSCSTDGTVRVWNTMPGQHEASFQEHRGWVEGVSYTPNGKYVVTGSFDGTLRILDATSGRIVGNALRGHLDRVTDVAVTADGKFVLSVSWDKTVRVWNFESGNLLHTLEVHTDAVWCVAVTPKGDRAVTGSSDKTVRVWDLEKMDGRHVVLEGHNLSVERVFVSDDGLRVISVDWKNGILVWSMETKQVLKTDVIDDARTMSRSELFNLIGEDTVHGDACLSIRRFSRQIIYRKGSEARVLGTLESDILSSDLSPDGRTICLGLHDGQVAILKFDV